MARFNGATIDKYGGNGSTGFFSLQNDMDVAAVRFLYNTADDIEGYAVHEVEIDGKKRYVNCIREYNQPVDDCPFCKAKKFQVAKLFIPVYNIDEDKVQLWERGKTFFGKISGICARYNKAPIVSQTFEIERHGKPKDTKTTYEIYRTEDPADDTQIEDFDIPEVLGGIVLDKTAEDMEFFLSEGYFPPTESEAPVRRSSTREREVDDRSDRSSEMPVRRRPGRRTPAGDDDRTF